MAARSRAPRTTSRSSASRPPSRARPRTTAPARPRPAASTLATSCPFDLVGLIYVSGAVDVGGSPYCEGSGWIQMRGDPVGTPGFVGGAGLALVGLATVLTSVRGRHPFRGAIGGLLGGAGLALLSGVTGVLPLDETTPLAEVIGMLVLGLLIGVIDFGSLFHRGSVSAVVEAGAPASVPPPSEPETGEPTGKPTEPATTPTSPVVPPRSSRRPVVPPPVVAPGRAAGRRALAGPGLHHDSRDRWSEARARARDDPSRGRTSWSRRSRRRSHRCSIAPRRSSAPVRARSRSAPTSSAG